MAAEKPRRRAVAKATKPATAKPVLKGDEAILARVLDTVRKKSKRGRSPVVVFDLDYTLFDNAPRTIAIFGELARRHRRDMPWFAKRLAGLSAADLPFDHESCLRLLGPQVEDHLPRLKSELGGMFFSSKYLLHDQPYKGGVEYVEACLMAGAVIVYMTGRDRIGMYDGTVASLTEHSFPLGHPNVHLVMKPDQVTKDFVFKATLRHAIREYGELVAFFDNEPANVNNFKEFYPDCIAVLMDTKHWPGAPEVGPKVVKIRGYRIRKSLLGT